ncbi:hypothetical protein E2C01_030018 [Portunus trituberculatus]|uniref:Uncharacterized protein n=1 Tax=Portunus trituberculatus TaxID=210409 RepID=A0A5B7ETS6_PORTR|nr:hypothetical protein [Portunus trituberculatus]
MLQCEAVSVMRDTYNTPTITTSFVRLLAASIFTSMSLVSGVSRMAVHKASSGNSAASVGGERVPTTGRRDHLRTPIVFKGTCLSARKKRRSNQDAHGERGAQEDAPWTEAVHYLPQHKSPSVINLKSTCRCSHDATRTAAEDEPGQRDTLQGT